MTKPRVPRGFAPTVDPEERPMAKRIRSAMVKAGISSQTELADIAEIRESTLRHVLRGGDPRLSTLVAIAHACGVSLDYLAEGKGKKA